MTIIVFLIDNSGSMASKTVNGLSYMDFAKQFVEGFLKQRQRDPISKNDRYMLMGFEEYPFNVKSGWREAQSHFNEQLRQLRPSGSSSFVESLYNAIRFVNLNRVQTGIENYGYGRYPSFSEPVVFIAVVDYNSVDISEDYVKDGFPTLPQPLGDLTDEPFRWDHRLFVVGLDIPGHSPIRDLFEGLDEDAEEDVVDDSLSFSSPELKSFISRMNGKLYRMKTAKNMSGILDAVLQKIQVNGVFVRLSKHGADPQAPKNPIPEVPKETSEPKTGIYMVDGEAKDDYVPKNEQPSEPFKEEVVQENGDWKKSVVLFHRGNKVQSSGQSAWPIPEGFWPDQTVLQLPPRKVYPEILFRCEESEQVSLANFPFDKYEVESGPLTEHILSRRDPSSCWQLFVSNSYNKPGIGFPFGYIKAASNLQSVNVFVFPYNYPLLFAILEESKDERLRGTDEFKQKLERYFRTIPSYYVVPLRKVLVKYPISHPLLDDGKPFHFLHFSVMQSFSKAKTQGKEDFDKTCGEIQKMERRPFISASMALPMATVTRTTLPDTIAQKKIALLSSYKQQIQPLYKDVTIAITETRISKDTAQRFLNPYLIERDDIIDQLEKMRVNLELNFTNSSIPALEGGVPGQRIRLQHAEDLHAQPVQKMGDFNLYAKRLAEIGLAPLRDFEPPQAKPHAFGNPFKLDKKSMAIDEVPADLNEGPDTAQMLQQEKEKNEKSDKNGKENRKRAASEPVNGATPLKMPKRRVGPIDQNTLNRWRKRRNNGLTDSDASSVVSDVGYINDLDDNNSFAQPKRLRYAESEPGDVNLMICEDEDEEQDRQIIEETPKFMEIETNSMDYNEKEEKIKNKEEKISKKDENIGQNEVKTNDNAWRILETDRILPENDKRVAEIERRIAEKQQKAIELGKKMAEKDRKTNQKDNKQTEGQKKNGIDNAVESSSSSASSEDEEDRQERLLDDCFDNGKPNNGVGKKPVIKVPITTSDLPSCSKDPEVLVSPKKAVSYEEDTPRLSRNEEYQMKASIRIAIRNHSRSFDSYQTILKCTNKCSVRERFKMLQFAKSESTMHRLVEVERKLDQDLQNLAQCIQFDDDVRQSLADSHSLSSSTADSDEYLTD
ncbi:unnamed protein product [Bursaphelenchus okinawaensis]|uniref:VWFA domain-containing protein n=1 Tax=Bursaphelenchus okinawaensis TaxID=465554 RepID=A0A811LMU4_9BILA|nr:unnamed protein product [Bursaphelenchus okinawaensis]CAG9127254.1 unnamed protein product [Bursaphelenchus okinawaensis]